MLNTNKTSTSVSDSLKIKLPAIDPRILGGGKKIGSNPRAILEEAGVKEGERVADFGCGVGFFVMELSSIVGSTGKVFAIDIDRDMLDSLKSKALDSGTRNIYGILANLEEPGSTGLDSESVDVVLMINLLHLIKNKDVVFSEAQRILKRGGKMVLMDWSDKGQHNMLEKEDAVDSKEVRDLAKKLGFKRFKTFEAGLAHEVNVYVKD